MGKSGQQIAEEQIIKALVWIHRFRWLRMLELARLLWPHQSPASQLVSVKRLVRHLYARTLVIVRTLPVGAGFGLVLSDAGVRALHTEGIHAKSGKDWGDTASGKWYAPESWLHDLLTSGAMSLMHASGWQMKTEWDLRRSNPSARKFPDALLRKVTPDGLTFVPWLEVECSRKSGEHMRQQADFLIQTASGSVPAFGDWEPNMALLAYNSEARDERGFRLDHHGRVRRMIELRARSDIRLWLAPLALKGVGVASIDLEEVDGGRYRLRSEVIKADRVSQVISEMNWAIDEQGIHFGAFRNMYGYVWEAGGGAWKWELQRHDYDPYRRDVPPDDIADGTAGSLKEAQRQIATMIIDELEG